MRTLIVALFALLLTVAPAAAVDETEKDLRPGLKQGAFETPAPQAPAPTSEEGGRPALPPAAVIGALVAAIAVLLVVCYPSRR